MNALQSWKPLIDVLALPPVSLLLLVLVGIRMLARHRVPGFLVVMLALSGLWLSACSGTARFIQDHLLKPGPALSPERIAALREEGRKKPQQTAIVVLGGGRHARAPEYGMSNLNTLSMARLRYGLWLAHETGLPVAYSGGVGWVQTGEIAEADVAARIAQREFNRPLKWVENTSRDTHENAGRTVPLLKADGIQHIVVVSHANHIPRALHHFNEVAQGSMRFTAAPIEFNLASFDEPFAWLPSANGMREVRHNLHELAGLTFGI
jgi:uncharacterized SAM-binding protein YcdF (DUF218 family)